MEGGNGHPGAPQGAGVALRLCLLRTHELKFTGQVMGLLVGEVQLLFYAFVFFLYIYFDEYVDLLQ